MQIMRFVMTASGMSHVPIGHCILCNVPKLQCCGHDNLFFNWQKTFMKTF